MPVANTDKGRMISLCGSGIDVFEQRSADEQTDVLDALQQFKDGSKVVLGIQSVITLSGRNNHFNPKEFFQTRKGLSVYDEFTDRILSVAKEVESLLAITISSYDLIKPANDSKIRAELPEGHVFPDASAFCCYLAGMIEQQANGEEGDLLNNGHANILYVVGKNGEVFTVFVCWNSGDRKWHVSASLLDVGPWNAGFRAFSTTAGS